MPEICAKSLCRHVIDNHSRDFQPNSCTKECQLNREKPREVKDNSLRPSQTSGVVQMQHKGKHWRTTLHREGRFNYRRPF